MYLSKHALAWYVYGIWGWVFLKQTGWDDLPTTDSGILSPFVVMKTITVNLVLSFVCLHPWIFFIYIILTYNLWIRFVSKGQFDMQIYRHAGWIYLSYKTYESPEVTYPWIMPLTWVSHHLPHHEDKNILSWQLQNSRDTAIGCCKHSLYQLSSP